MRSRVLGGFVSQVTASCAFAPQLCAGLLHVPPLFGVARMRGHDEPKPMLFAQSPLPLFLVLAARGFETPTCSFGSGTRANNSAQTRSPLVLVTVEKYTKKRVSI